MEAEEKDVKKRRRRSIRNLRRRSEIVPFEIDFLSEESQGEKEKEDACNFKPGIPNEKDLFGSLWMETNEPVLKKKKRRSSLFMSAPQQTHIVESQFTENEPDNVSSNGNVSPTAILSPNVYVTETKSDYINSPRLSVRNTCSDELMSENIPATEDTGFLQPIPMTKTDIGCCQSTFNASSDVTPTNSVPSISTPSSMSPEYSESPTEHFYGNSNEESCLSSETIDKKGDLEHTQFDFDQSFISISNKENVNNKSTVPLETNLKVTETDPDVTLDSRVNEDMEKNSSSSPGILSISKAIGKVVDFVKTSPSYIFGSVNGSKTDQQTTSPVLKVITDKNVISLSTSGRNNDLSFSDNDDTDCLCEKDQTLETQPREKMDIFLDTYNAIMKVFQKTSVDNDKDSKNLELNQNTITNYQEEAHSTDGGMMEASEPPTPNKEIPSEIVEKHDQKERGNAANDLQTTENTFDSISSVSEINHKTDNETLDIVQNHDQVEIKNTTNFTQIIVNDYEPTSRMCEKVHEKDSLIKTVVPKTANEISWKDNKMDLNYSTEMLETTGGQECDIQTDISTENNENNGLGNCTNTDVDHFLDTSMEIKKYETNTDVENSKTVDITKHGDLFSRPETDIYSPHIDKTLPKVLSRSENIIQKYKRRSKDSATLKSQLPLKNKDVSFNKDDSEINSFTRKSVMHGQSDIKAICRKYNRKGRRSADHTKIMLDLDLPTVLEDIDGVQTTHNSVDNVELICTDNPVNSKLCSGFNLESEMSVCAVPIEKSLQSHNGENKNVETTENRSYTNTNTVTDNNLVTQTGLVKKRRGRPIKKSVIKTEVNEVNIGTEISSIKVFEEETIYDNDSGKVSKGRRRSRRSLDNNTLMAEVKSFRENADKQCSGDTGKNDTDEREVDNNLMFRKRRKSSDKSSLETVFEKELSESADSAKTTKLSKSKKRKTDDDVDIEKIYRNKNFIKPEQHKPWQTIFESPDKFGETLGKKRMQRYINFEMPSQMKLRRRLQKATKNGWNPTLKKRTVLNDQEVKDKLNSLWLDLDSSNTKTDALEDKLRAIVETE